MLESVLFSLASAFNLSRAHLDDDAARLSPSRVFDDERRLAFPANSLAIALVSVGLDPVLVRALSMREPQDSVVARHHVERRRWALRVVIAAHDADYRRALRDLSAVLDFFSAYPVIQDDPERLRVCVCALSADDQHHLWSTLGGRALPSVVLDVGVSSSGPDDGTVVRPAIMGA
jgi:hypothetical protein